MSIGPLNIAASAAGSPLAQTKGTETERTEKVVGAQRRQVYHEEKAEAAAGIGEPDGEDHDTHQRNADGRRWWEDQPEPEPSVGKPSARQSKDPLQQSGNLLDLTG